MYLMLPFYCVKLNKRSLHFSSRPKNSFHTFKMCVRAMLKNKENMKNSGEDHNLVTVAGSLAGFGRAINSIAASSRPFFTPLAVKVQQLSVVPKPGSSDTLTNEAELSSTSTTATCRPNSTPTKSKSVCFLGNKRWRGSHSRDGAAVSRLPARPVARGPSAENGKDWTPNPGWNAWRMSECVCVCVLMRWSKECVGWMWGSSHVKL